jgi:cholesterol oxidase
MWPETTTLYTRVLAGHVQAPDNDAEIIGSGILRILPTDFAWQMTTFRARGPTPGTGLSGLAAFGKFFVSQLREIYGPKGLSPRRA